MQIQKLDHVGIRVMDVDKSMQFYKTLGFQVTRADHKEQVFVVKHQSGIEINLIAHGTNDYGKQNILMDVEDKYPGYTHYAIAIDSIEDAKAFFESINIKITGGPVTFGDGKTSIFIRDPDLNVLEFTELPKIDF
ncbi:VOC family protein [Leptolyngbya cf. ectocarpi LEGE 11479]|uniref:VOC family protein n=1 Tax=Leptolyngbya cf. ectocarpi LEGE 11479 TaxID=1828722 RepID=A0A928ZVH1_LEPEC|nr:VOC family protein [Leptolyngbya ectocarpi]MBE9068178.1 VOC family protein [Leptolyngbya cf. ectocarpi LEGE 11479]